MKRLLICLLFPVMAWAGPPQSLIDEAKDATTVHKGWCEFPTYKTRCIVGIDPNTEVMWVLLFDEKGNLYRVLNVTQDGKETERWLRPSNGA